MSSLEVEKHSVQWSFKRQITEIVLLILFLFPGKANVALTMLACALRTATTIAWLGFLA